MCGGNKGCYLLRLLLWFLHFPKEGSFAEVSPSAGGDKGFAPLTSPTFLKKSLTKNFPFWGGEFLGYGDFFVGGFFWGR